MAAASSIAATAIAPVVGHSAAHDEISPAESSGTESSSPPSPALAPDELRKPTPDAAPPSEVGAGAGGDVASSQDHADDAASHEDASGPVHRQPSVLDIEHLPVDDDPRLWPSRRKAYVFGSVSVACILATLAASIYFPAIADVKRDLNASDQAISLSAGLFILLQVRRIRLTRLTSQGFCPMAWASLAEVFGRRLCYRVALSIFIMCAETQPEQR